MKINVLTFGKENNLSPITKKDLELLSQAAEKLGHQINIIYAPECQLKFDKKPEVFVKNKKVKIDVILNRPNFLHEHLDFRAGLIKQFELAGIKVINNYAATMRAKNKLRTMQMLTKNKIPIPKTYILNSSEHLEEIVKDIGSFPVIIKSLSGSHGSGVSIVESKRGLKSLLDLLTSSGSSEPIMIQEYIKESSGKDIRVFIVGKRIVGAMERIATKKGEFRSNFHLGGRVRVAEMSRKEKDVAFAAINACKLDIAGVDILRTKKGPKVLEVNSNPGLEGITEATGRDIAGEIIKYTVQKTKQQLKKQNKK
mgnify:CR=1 FL=1